MANLSAMQVVLDWETLPPLEQKRQQAIQDLIRSEDHYLTDLKFGIEVRRKGTLILQNTR